MFRQRNTIIFIIILLSIMPATSVPASAQGVSGDLLGRINGLRTELSLQPYQLNSALTAAAQSHAQWMADTSQVTHVQPSGSTPRSRAVANGYSSSWVAENIYMGPNATVNSAWTFWVNSSLHYAGLTSTNFRDIGIASAQGAGGQAFVLVFGNPGGQVPQTASNSSDGGNAASAAPAVPPVAIVGYDDVGNIQYELQAGETLGDVLLLFGYTWDDLQTMLDLNGFTDADIRALDVGQVVLVPPPQGTYTPTPIAEAEITAEPESTPESTAESANDASSEPTAITNTDGILPAIDTVDGFEDIDSPDSSDTNPTATASPTALPTRTDIPTETPTISVSPTQTAIPTLAISSRSELLPTATPLAVAQANDLPSDEIALQAESPSSGPPLWLIIAVIAQVGVLVVACVQFIRQQGN